MLIKTLRHKYNSIGDLLFYMVNGMEDKGKDMMIAHNLPSFDIETMKHEFLKNDLYRQETKAQVRWYHEILSFSPFDKEALDTRTLERIARQYIEMRNPRAMCYAVAHTSEAHIHLHFCFSGSEYRSKNILRMDDRTFKGLRIGMEKWQMKNLPHLKNSIVYLDRRKEKRRTIDRDRNSRNQKEFHTKKRLGGRTTEKGKLASTLKGLFNKSRDVKQFYSSIKAADLTLLERNGKVTGVIGNRRYRFKTLGITNEMLMSLDRLSARQREVQRLMARNRETGLER